MIPGVCDCDHYEWRAMELLKVSESEGPKIHPEKDGDTHLRLEEEREPEQCSCSREGGSSQEVLSPIPSVCNKPVQKKKERNEGRKAGREEG